jgi:hypothetical protein
MEPRIHAQTSDGVSIAYTVLGDGPAIVIVGSAFGDVHLYSSGVGPYRQIMYAQSSCIPVMTITAGNKQL